MSAAFVVEFGQETAERNGRLSCKTAGSLQKPIVRIQLVPPK